MEGLQTIEPTMSANPETKPQSTELDPLRVALKFIVERLGLSRVQLTERYGLSRMSLYRLWQGDRLERAYDFYLGVFVRILNERRLLALKLGDTERQQEIDHLLRDLLLMHCGVPTDAELAQSERQKKNGVP